MAGKRMDQDHDMNTTDYGIVGIVTINYNNAQETLECIDSVHQLEYRNKMVFVVDNGSTASSVTELQTGLRNRKYKEVRLLQSPVNLGFGGGCNLGIEEAMKREVEYIWLLNNDTRVDSLALTALVRTLVGNPALGAVGSVLRSMEEPNSVICWGGGAINLITGRGRYILTQNDESKMMYLSGASMLLRNEVLQRTGLFDSKRFFMYWEDVDLSFRIKAEGYSLGVVKESVVFHRGGASTKNNLRLREKYATESQIAFFHRNCRYSSVPLFISIAGRCVKCIGLGRFGRVSGLLMGLRSAWSRKMK